MSSLTAQGNIKPARLNWIDYARGLAIILVAYRHVYEGAKQSGVYVDQYKMLEYVNIFLFPFRMPLFFIVSGIFISISVHKNGMAKYIGTRARTILYPYFLWGALQLLLQMVFAQYSNGKPEPSALLHLFYLPRELAQFWYLYALFNVSMLYLFTKFILRLPALLNFAIGIGLFYLSGYLYQQTTSSYLVLNILHHSFLFDVLHYYIFFVIGDLAGRYLTSQQFRSIASSGKNVLLLLLVFLAAQSYFLMANLRSPVPKFMYVEFYQPFVFLLIALTGCLFMIFLTCWIDKKNILKWLPVLGRHSLYIYVAHVIVFAAVRTILMRVFHIEDPLIIIFSGMLFGITVPVLMYKLADRFNMRWIFTLEKKKEKLPGDRMVHEPEMKVKTS